MNEPPETPALLNSISPGAPVLVTGATGFTGSVLTRKLVSAGLSVKAIARESSSIAHLKDLNIEWFRGNVFDQAVAERACDGVEYVFHVAAAFREAKLSDADYWNVHVRSTHILAGKAAQNLEFKRFIHVSTVGVHGHIDNPPANEEYRFKPGDIYQKTKAEAELWIRDFAPKNDLPLTVIRPAAIYGPEDRRLLKVFKMAKWPFFPILGRGKCLYHLIHVEDLTDIMILAATHPAAQGEVFIAGSPECMTLENIARIGSEAMGKKLKPVRLPAWPFFLAGYMCEGICKPFGIEPPIYPRRVAFFTKDRAFDTSKLRNRLGYDVKFSNEEGLKNTVEQYIAKGWL